MPVLHSSSLLVWRTGCDDHDTGGTRVKLFLTAVMSQ